MKSLTGVMAFVLTLGLIAGACYAQPGQPRKKDGNRAMRPEAQKGMGNHKEGRAAGARGMRIIKSLASDPELAKQIGLEDYQIKKLRQELYNIEKKNIELNADLRLAGLEQARAMIQDDVSEEEVMQAVEKAGEVRTKLAKLRARQMLLVKQTLSADQLEKLRQEMQRKRQRSKEKLRGRTRNKEQDLRRNKNKRREGNKNK